MPLLPFLGGLFTSIASFFAAWVSKKVAMVAAVLSVSAALWLTFAALIVGLLAGIEATIPAWAAEGIAMFLPANLPACISALFTAKLGRAAYEYQKENLRLASYVT